MPGDRHDDITSGFVNPTQGEMFASFARRETIATPGYNLLVKAEQDGQWWLLKGLKPEYREQGVYRALLRKEYDIAKRLRHPGVVSTTALIEDEELGPCIVMEWIEGVTLGEWMDERHTRAERRDIARQLINAVEYLHRMNVVHRDLKPANVMVTLMGHNVVLIDFGFADKPSHALFKQAAGTEGYIPEEQLDEDVLPDVRHDIYSLGKILQELKPGGAYAAVTRRCLAPIARRYASVKALRDDRTRLERLQRTARWGLALAALALVLVAAYRLSDNGAVSTPVPTPTGDTVSNVVNDVAAPSPPTQEASPAVAPSPSALDPLVAQAIEQGKRRLDEAVERSGIEARMASLTADDWYGNRLYFSMTMGGIKDGIDTHARGLDLTSEQKALVAEKVNYYYNDTYVERWKKFIAALPISEEEWYRQRARDRDSDDES